jgi:hypothetical protein
VYLPDEWSPDSHARGFPARSSWPTALARDHRHHRIVEIVRDATGERAQRLETLTLGVLQLRLELAPALLRRFRSVTSRTAPKIATIAPCSSRMISCSLRRWRDSPDGRTLRNSRPLVAQPESRSRSQARNRSRSSGAPTPAHGAGRRRSSPCQRRIFDRDYPTDGRWRTEFPLEAADLSHLLRAPGDARFAAADSRFHEGGQLRARRARRACCRSQFRICRAGRSRR